MFAPSIVTPESYNPSLSFAPLYKKRGLAEKNIIDEFFNTIGSCKFPPLEDEEKKRLSEGLKKPSKFAFGNLVFEAPIHEVLFCVINAVSKLPLSERMQIKFVGSFVLSILGRSYIERLFAFNGVHLNEYFTEQEWEEVERDFKKTHRDIDLRIYLPLADDKKREEVRNVLTQILIPFVATRAKKTEKEVDQAVRMHLSPPTSDNIMDGNTKYLRTPLGSSELMLDINWVQSMSREKLFEEDDISFEVNPVIFANPEKIGEIIPQVSTQSLKPFIDILYGLITVSDPTTVNKRGWAKMLLKELKGKRILVEKDALTLFNSAYSLFIRGVKKTQAAFADNFFNLIEFCYKEHTLLDFSSRFLLHLQGISNLYHYQNRKELICNYQSEDIEAIKAELLKIPPPAQNEGILPLLFSYLEDKEMTLDLLFDLLTFYRDRYGLVFNCQNVKYQLDLKGRIPKDPAKAAQFLIKKMNKNAFTETELNLCIAVNNFVPRQELQETILFNISPHLKENDHLICNVSARVFAAMRDNLGSYPPKEALLRALFSDLSTLAFGVKWLTRHPELFYLRASCAVLAFNLHPLEGLKVIKAFHSDLKPQERKQVVKLILNRLSAANALEQASFGTALRGFDELIRTTPDPDLSYNAYDALSQNFPELRPALIPLLSRERFHQQEGFLTRITGTPDELDSYFKTFSVTSLRWLLDHAKHSSPQVLSIIRTLYRMNQIDNDSSLAFRLLFEFNISPNELPQLYFNQCCNLMIKSLEARVWPVSMAQTNSKIIDIVKASPRKVELALGLLELELPENSQSTSLVEIVLASSPDEILLRRTWPYATSSAHRSALLLTAYSFPGLEKEALQEMQKCNVDPARIADAVYKLLELCSWRLACQLIRQFSDGMPLDEVIPILINKIHNEALTYEHAEALFELFQIPQMRRMKKIHALTVYKKAFETTSDLLARRIYRDVKTDFTKEEIAGSQLLLSLVRSIACFHTDEIKSELPYLLEVFRMTTNYPAVSKHLAPLARKEIADTDEGRNLISVLSPHCPAFRSLETALLVESNSDDQFLAGMKRREYKKLPVELAARLYRVDPLEFFIALNDMQTLSSYEFEQLFDIMTRSPLHPKYLTLLKGGFLNGLKKTAGREERCVRLAQSLDAVSAIELCTVSVMRDFLAGKGYHYLLKWRDELIATGRYDVLPSLSVNLFEEDDRLDLFEALFFHREDLRPALVKEVNQLSKEYRLAFFKKMLKKIRKGNTQHCLSFFNLFAKSEDFIKNNRVIDLLALIGVNFPENFAASLILFMTQRMKTIVSLNGYSIKCEEYNISPIETYRSGSPLVLTPFLDHPIKKSVPRHIEAAFFQVLGLVLSKFTFVSIGLHRMPQHAGFLLDFVALNLFYRGENIRSSENLKFALAQFIKPVVSDVRKYSAHIRNLTLIENVTNPEANMVFADPSMITTHIYLGNPLFSESLEHALNPLKTVIESLVQIRREPFAPICILHALNLIKGYNVELFRSHPEFRVRLCETIFAAIEKHPEVLKMEELGFRFILEALLPKNNGLNLKEYKLYSELIRLIRAKCYHLFQNTGLDYVNEAMTLYVHLLEREYVQGDEHLLNMISCIVEAAEKSITLSDDAFTSFAEKLRKILCLDFKEKEVLKLIMGPFLKKMAIHCLERLNKSDRVLIKSFKAGLEINIKKSNPDIFRESLVSIAYS